MSNTPNVLKIGGSVEKQSLGRIETLLQDPMYISDQSVSFQFPTTGILDSNTTLILPVVGADANQFLPLSSGIYSLLKTCTMSCNGQVLATTDEAGILMSLRECFKPYEVRERRLRCEKGIYSAVDTDDNVNSAVRRSQYRLSATYTQANPSVGTLPANYNITNNATTTAPFYIRLGEMFPELFNNLMLPIGLLSHPLQLDITFSGNVAGDANERTRATGVAAITGATVDTANVKLKIDLLYFNDGTMSELARQASSKNGINFVYGDYITVRTGLTHANPAAPGAGIANTETHLRNIGMSNQVLRHLLFATPKADSSNPLLGRYSSAGSSPSDDANRDQWQITINSVPIFNQAVGNPAQLNSYLEEVFGTPCQLPQGAMSMGGSCYDAFDVAQHAILAYVPAPVLYNEFANRSAFSPTATLQGQTNDENNAEWCWRGFNFQKPIVAPDGTKVRANYAGAGIVINENPILISYRNSNVAQNFAARDMYVFGCVERQFVLRNGLIYLSQSSM